MQVVAARYTTDSECWVKEWLSCSALYTPLSADTLASPPSLYLLSFLRSSYSRQVLCGRFEGIHVNDSFYGTQGVAWIFFHLH